MVAALDAHAPLLLRDAVHPHRQERAVLARVVASGAPLWLLDEPANGLDAEGRERLAAAMAAHRAGGGAILAATHQPLGLDDAKTVALG